MGLTPVVVALDGGGSKTDAVAVTLAGEVVARLRGPGSSAAYEGLAASAELVDGLVREVACGAEVVRAGLYLSGLDLPREVEAYRAAVSGRPWAAGGLDVDNDLFALLRAGTDAHDAVAVICGTGMNAVGIRADGQTARFLAVGPISGDWGGGHGLGMEALWHAAREADGRGPRTLLTHALEAEFGMRVPAIIDQFHLDTRGSTDLSRLAPAVFDTADAGDLIALSLVDRQADEVVAFVRACVGRLGLTGAIPVVLGGGILQSGHPRLLGRIADGVREISPQAHVVTLTGSPVLGAVRLTLERAGATPAALAVADAALERTPVVAANGGAATR